ncbi:hypothetical protein [Antarcticimicrobium sediminis]|uniref:Uncharacterized protein n=1 Tax=Antarcticimicrobium sediminis TaxID=2546227 RepID=A0A4R5EKA7_9RHOB|nr:hypothetical protein [Antarcticimicrobium sediminis]TDE34924.1 hypothetical protein E1B25_18520 [Antarcticimicrobium sediminis]
MDHHAQRTSENNPTRRKLGQDTYRRRAEALALAGLMEPVLFVSMKPSRARAHDGLSLRGRSVFGLAGRALEVRVREILAPAFSRDDTARSAHFELDYHGLMLPGVYNAVPLYRVYDVISDMPHWRGEQTFLLGRFSFHLFQLEAVLPEHGWLLTMRGEAENVSS